MNPPASAETATVTTIGFTADDFATLNGLAKHVQRLNALLWDVGQFAPAVGELLTFLRRLQDRWDLANQPKVAISQPIQATAIPESTTPEKSPFKRRREPLTWQEQEQVADLLRRGVPGKEIARQFGCSHAVVSRIAGQFEVGPRYDKAHGT